MLTDKAIKAAKAKDKLYRLTDSYGLYFEVHPNGSKTWLFRFRMDGKRSDIRIGKYPDIPLKTARAERDKYRLNISNGINPIKLRESQRIESIRIEQGTFKAISEEWWEFWQKGKAENTQRQRSRFLKHILSTPLGVMPVENIRLTDLKQLITPLVKKGQYQTAKMLLGVCNMVFSHARRNGFNCVINTRDLSPIIPSAEKKHFAAATDEQTLAEILNALDTLNATPATKAALQLLPMFGVRPSELVNAKWADIDLKAAEWRYTTSKTKTPHIVPLSRQAVAILKKLRRFTGAKEYAFSSEYKPNRHITTATLLDALRRCGIAKDVSTNHGFRATMRTLLEERLGYDERLTEHQLAHTVHDTLGRAYNRTKHLSERRNMMQHWADYLDDLKTGNSKPILNAA